MKIRMTLKLDFKQKKGFKILCNVKETNRQKAHRN